MNRRKYDFGGNRYFVKNRREYKLLYVFLERFEKTL